MQEALHRHQPSPAKRPVCPRRSSRLVQQSDHVDLPFDPIGMTLPTFGADVRLCLVSN